MKNFFILLFSPFCLNFVFADAVDDYNSRKIELQKKREQISSRSSPSSSVTGKAANNIQTIAQQNNEQQIYLDSDTAVEISDLNARKAGLPTIREIQQYYDKNGTIPPIVIDYNKKVMSATGQK